MSFTLGAMVVQNPNSTIRTFLITIFLLFSFNVRSQELNKEVSISFNNWPIEKAISYLSQNYGLLFSYSTEMVNTGVLVSINTQKNTLEIVLHEIFEQAGLEYELRNHQIMVRKKSKNTRLIDIKGTVVDASTNSPLPGANVYFNNSTIGISTDENGQFSFRKISTENNELVVSYVGYKTLTSTVDFKSTSDPRLLIKLQPDIEQLKEVLVKTTRDEKWQRDFVIFEKEFLGQTPNAKLCRILNSEVLRFNRVNETLFVNAKEPIQLQNEALGYKVSVSIETCSIDPREGYSFVFHSQFYPIESKDEREMIRWEINRLHSYLGSETHLFRAMIKHDSFHQGFDIFRKNKTELVMKGDQVMLQSIFSDPYGDRRVTLDSNFSGFSQVFEKGQYLIKYVNRLTTNNAQRVDNSYSPTTIIEVKSESLMVNAKGDAVIAQSDYERNGYMGNQRMADKLPHEFDPEISEKVINQYLFNRLDVISGVVLDSITKKPIAGAEVFINNSTIYTKTSSDGRFALSKIPKGQQEVGVFKSNYEPLVKFLLTNSRKVKCDTLLITKRNHNVTNKIISTDQSLPLQLLRSKLVGKSFFGVIENEKSITVNKDMNGDVSFSSKDPLEITFEKTRYKVKFFIQSAFLKSKPSYLKVNGLCYFQNLDTLFENTKTEINRLMAYEGSLMHFTRALLLSRWKEEGFDLFIGDPSTNHSKFPIRKNKGQSELYPDQLNFRENDEGTAIQLPQQFIISYTSPDRKSKNSKFILEKPLIVSGFGTICSPNTVIIYGSMNQTTTIPLLPIDYWLPKEIPLRQF
jgi:hypothetical protein